MNATHTVPTGKPKNTKPVLLNPIKAKISKSAPKTKADMIRMLSEKFTPGEIRAKLLRSGVGVHYSEIYGAIQRTA
jgi:hypothetical protein